VLQRTNAPVYAAACHPPEPSYAQHHSSTCPLICKRPLRLLLLCNFQNAAPHPQAAHTCFHPADSVMLPPKPRLPTFATAHGGPSEIIRHGRSGFHIDPYHGEQVGGACLGG
jgi:hypothetical protein